MQAGELCGHSGFTSSPSPGADVAGVRPSPGADVAGVSPSPGADVAWVSPSPGADVAGADLPKEVAVEAAQPVAPARADRHVPDVRARERRSGSLCKPMHGVLGVLTGPLPPAVLRRYVPL